MILTHLSLIPGQSNPPFLFPDFQQGVGPDNGLDQGLGIQQTPTEEVGPIEDRGFDQQQFQDFNTPQAQQVQQPTIEDPFVPPPARPEGGRPRDGEGSRRRRDREDDRESGLFFFDGFEEEPQQRASRADFAPSLTALTFDVEGGRGGTNFTPFDVRALPDANEGRKKKKKKKGRRDPLENFDI